MDFNDERKSLSSQTIVHAKMLDIYNIITYEFHKIQS